MSVTEVTQALGAWSLTLRADTPRVVLDAIGYFGHVAITTRRSEAAAQQDSLRRSARYVGVVRGITRADDTQPITLSGSGMGFWLGDENDAGAVYTTAVTLTAATFSASITALLPSSGAVTAGTIGTAPGTISQSFQWTSPRTAFTKTCSLFTSGTAPSQIMEWRVNGDATVDADTVANLYTTVPVCAIVRRNPGIDMTLRSLPGSLQNASDVMNYASGVSLLAAGVSGSTSATTVVLGSVPYKDMHGNPVDIIRVVSQSTTNPTNGFAAAGTALAALSSPASALVLSTDEFDVRGELAAGDYVWVQDPDAGLIDLTQEVHLRGDVLNPVLLRCVELDWPITQGMGAAYRDQNGVWTDLSDYIVPESGITNVVVGALSSPLIPPGEPVGSRPVADTSVPDILVTGAATTSVYLGPSDGKAKAQLQMAWSTPLNTDGSTIIDGSHYEIRYQPDVAAAAVNPTWAALNAGGYTWAALNAAGATWNQVLPAAAAQWHTSTVGWGTNSVLIQELTPGVSYNVQIRAVDTASPPNFGAWSALVVHQAGVDTIAPPTPDAPTVAAGLLSVLVSWDCGTAVSGAFTQAVDLNHIEVHGSYDPLFAPTSATKLANVQANIANITGGIPVVATVALPPSLPVAQNVYVKLIAVDNSGNKSLPSASAGVTATLLSDQYISNLSVSKLTAGTITASVILGGTIATAASGQRCVMDSSGFHAYDSAGNLTFDVNDSSPIITLGQHASGASITIDTSATYPIINFLPNTGTNKAFINALTSGSGSTGIGVNSGTYNSEIDATTVNQRLFLEAQGNAQLGTVNAAQNPHGGVLGLGDLGTTLGQYNNGTLVTGISFDYASKIITGTGLFSNNPFMGSTDAWFTGLEVGLTSFTGASFTYGPTLAGVDLLPIPAVLDTTSSPTTRGCYIGVLSNTGFGIEWTSTTVSATSWWSPIYA